MNLHLNLILESEKRSGASIRMWFAVRTGLMLIPIALLLYLLLLIYQTRSWQREKMHIRDLNAARADQIALSEQIGRQKKMYEEMLTQLEIWEQTRLPLGSSLESLRRSVPLEIQLTSLRLVRTILYTNTLPVARYEMQIRGKTSGEEAEGTVERFLNSILGQPGLLDHVANARVPPGAFLQDREPGAHPLDRIFLLEVLFKPRGRINP